MEYFLKLSTDQGDVTLPARRVYNNVFQAESTDQDVQILDVRLFEGPDPVIRFAMADGGITLADESGVWTIELGKPKGRGRASSHLQYYATKQFGRKVKNPVVFEWDQEREELVGN